MQDFFNGIRFPFAGNKNTLGTSCGDDAGYPDHMQRNPQAVNNMSVPGAAPNPAFTNYRIGQTGGQCVPAAQIAPFSFMPQHDSFPAALRHFLVEAADREFGVQTCKCSEFSRQTHVLQMRQHEA
ncbi:hypothetical protein D3C73_1131670 [compost metagenome]